MPKSVGQLVKYNRNAADLKRVKNLVLLGLPHTAIATCLGENGVDVLTLEKYYREELLRYRQEKLGKIAAGAYRAALPIKDGGDPDVPPEIRSRMQIFILKTRAGWRESDSTVINAQNVQIVKRVIGIDEGEI